MRVFLVDLVGLLTNYLASAVRTTLFTRSYVTIAIHFNYNTKNGNVLFLDSSGSLLGGASHDTCHNVIKW